MNRWLETTARAAVMIVGLVNLTGCSAWMAATADEDADTADKALRCMSKNVDFSDPKQAGAYSSAADASRRADDIAALAKSMEAKADSSTFTKAQWDSQQQNAEQDLAFAKARLANIPMYGGMTADESYKKTGSFMPNTMYMYADEDVHKAERRLAIVNELKGQDLNAMVAAADKEATAAVEAAATVPKCRDVAQKSPGASANRDLLGSQGGRAPGPGGGGPGGHPPGGGGGPAGGGGGGGPEGP